MKENAGHYVVGKFKSHASFLSDEEYGKVLDSIVITCADIVLINKGKMLLGKRTRDPQHDWWVIGGRMKPGESFEEAASRNLKRELGLSIDLKRFKYLTTFSAVWDKRHHPPKENGIHTVSVVMCAKISDDEVESIITNDEYEKIEWVNPCIIIDGSYHGAVKQCAEAISSIYS